MNMKKGIIVLTLLLTLGMCVPTLAQKHRHTPRGTELVDTTKQSSAIDAFSDTTSVDSVFDASNTNSVNFQWDSDNDEDVEKVTSDDVESRSYVTGVGKYNDTLISILNIPALITDVENE